MNHNEKIDKLLNLKVLAPSQEELEQSRKEFGLLIWLWVNVALIMSPV